MAQHEEQDISSPMPILRRLDRLDRLLQFLEHKHCLSASHSSSPACKTMEPVLDYQRKTLASAIEEAHQKGTLMERVAVLENRVLQLSHKMDVENASRSSYSTILVSEDKQDPYITQGEPEVVLTEANVMIIACRSVLQKQV
ncbi:PREDICTED: POPTR_0001s46030g [Prunus dulcis]|uniref:PREDICTED: POPTR_0001s46030g n=1 Tax=Prunus dulcis TaxID=3755 RepID=A0A5E4E408_PRUDU|nr:PREDICTED: POPTR_0001s46030g [Prunus dulcis]